MRRKGNLFLWGSLLSLLVRCAIPPVAGGISDHGNSRISCIVYRQDRTPLSGGYVRLRGEDFLADTTELVASEYDARTDSRGAVVFDSIEPGTWFIEILDSPDSASIGVVLKLVVPNRSTHIRVADTVRPTARLSGSIDTAGMGEKSVFVRIAGLNRGVRCDTSGHWTISRLPGFEGYRLVVSSMGRKSPVVHDTIEISLDPGEDRDLGLFSTSRFLVEDTTLVRAILDTLGLTTMPVDRVSGTDGRRVTRLMLENLGITSLPPITGGLAGLQTLNLAYNRLTSLPESLRICRRITMLDLSRNALSRIPSVVFELDSLRRLDLSYNRIADTLPGDIGRLTRLDTLYLGANLLTALPPQIGKCVRLLFVSVDQNRLSTLPAEMACCSLLTKINCNDNLLDSLPRALGAWRGLRVFNAQVNGLTSLPEGFGRMDSLVEVRLHLNRLVSIPFTYAQIRRFEYFTLHTNRICESEDSLRITLDGVLPGWRNGQSCP